jgi:hypothetical protein
MAYLHATPDGVGGGVLDRTAGFEFTRLRAAVGRPMDEPPSSVNPIGFLSILVMVLADF